MLRWTAHLKGPKRQHAAVAVGHQVYSFGGYCAWDTSDTHAYGRDRIHVHVFNTVSLRWRTLATPTATPTGRGEPHPPRPDPLDDEVPSMRDGHTAVPIGDVIYIWGGFKYTRECCDVLYAFRADTHRWFRPGVSGTAPEARCGHSACVLDKVMYVYGGFNVASRHTYSDIYRLDTAAAAAAWSPINAGGAPASVSECHSATVIGTKMFVFGGTADQIEINYNDVRVFDTETDCWLSGTAAAPPTAARGPLPEGRACHSAFAHNGELYIFGGANFLWDWSFSEEMWRFSPEASSWKKVEPKENGPRSMSRMCCCVVRGRVVLFGGYRCVHTPAPVDVEDCQSVDDDDVGHREGEVTVQNLHNEDMDGDADDVEGLEDEGACDAEVSDLYILDLSPSLKTLCKLAVIQCGLEQSELPHDIRWELAAMATNGNRKPVQKTEEHCSEQLPGNLSGRKRKARGLLPIQKENIT